VKRSNFTLIELVVAIAILIMVAGIVGVAGSAFYNGYDRSVRVTNHLKQFMAIDNLMDTHIRNMVPFKWKDEEGTSRLVFDGEEERIHFTTLRRSYGNRPGALLFVRVFVEEDQLVAEYSPYPRLPWEEDGDESSPYTREVIAENVRQVTFSYAEKSTEVANGIEFLTEYREEENKVLPLAVMMKVGFHDGTTEQWLRRVAGVSRNSTFGYRDKETDEENSGENSGNSSGTAVSNSSSGRIAPSGGRVPGGGRRPGGFGGGRRPGGFGGGAGGRRPGGSGGGGR